MEKTSYSLNQEMGNGELGMTTPQMKSASESCVANALKGLSVKDKSSLKQIIFKVKADLVQVADMLQAQKNRNREQLQLLNNEIQYLKNSSSSTANFRHGFDLAIVSCRDAANIFETVKSFTDRIYTTKIELNYRLGVKNVIDQTLSTQVALAQNALISLDKILYILG